MPYVVNTYRGFEHIETCSIHDTMEAAQRDLSFFAPRRPGLLVKIDRVGTCPSSIAHPQLTVGQDADLRSVVERIVDEQMAPLRRRIAAMQSAADNAIHQWDNPTAMDSVARQLWRTLQDIAHNM